MQSNDKAFMDRARKNRELIAKGRQKVEEDKLKQKLKEEAELKTINKSEAGKRKRANRKARKERKSNGIVHPSEYKGRTLDLYNKQRNSKMSSGEKLVHDHLNSLGVKFEREYVFCDLVNRKRHKMLFFDFYLYEKKACIEYDGEYHFEVIVSEEHFKRQKRNDALKDKHCKKKGIPLLRIDYRNKLNIKNIINNFLKTL